MNDLIDSISSISLSSEPDYYHLTKFQLSRTYGLVCTISFNVE